MQPNKRNLVHDVTKAKIIPDRTGPNLLTREYPKLSGFLQGLMGKAPDEVGGGSVLDEDAQSSRKLQALGAKYGFPIGTVLGMLPFGGGVAKAPSVAAGSRTAQRGIIKAPGGNWLSGSVEDAVRGLKKLAPAQGRFGDPVPYHLLEPSIEGADGAVNNWIDSQLVKKYIKNEMATERDPLRLMADAWPEKKAAKLAEVQSRIDALAERTRQLARERGQPEHTLVEMRQLMIPLEKEKALIEATEGLHYAPNDMTAINPPTLALQDRRMQAGFPSGGVAVSPDAKRWEVLGDSALVTRTTGAPFGTGKNTYGEIHAGLDPKDAWMRTADPSTKVHEVNRDRRSIDALSSDLGFNHLIDELRNSLNPESGLPKELLMRYQDLPKVTVPQAAERVAQINAWRAAQKREADLLIANNAATVLHKEYPEKGLKWVEFKPTKDLPEGWRDGKDAFGTDMVFGPEGYATIRGSIKDPRHSTLADALKYEGDQMAHCVGGYCPDVLEGRSRIFSLRDAKGKPHTTIEVAPWRSSQGESLAQFEARLRADPARSEEAVRQIMSTPRYTDSIKQIKGYKNAKPDDEYLPYVQDFVKSGKWSTIGDFQNAGLIKRSNLLQKEQELMPELGDYLTLEEIQAMRKGKSWTPIDTDPDMGELNFAQGGLVSTGYNPSLVNARAAQLEAELFN